MDVKTSPSGPIRPVILSGGIGTRLWPYSRELHPKQLLPLVTDFSLLEETVRRIVDTGRFTPPLVLCNEAHRFLVAEQLRCIKVEPDAIVLEPEGRNTAPAATVAALMATRQVKDALLLLLPSDHVISDLTEFHARIDAAATAALNGALVAFGITPPRTETGYGYIQQGRELDSAAGCYQVTRFVEKPEAARIEAMLTEGSWWWNSGMFLFSAKSYMEELERIRPEILEGCRNAIERGRDESQFFRLDADSFHSVPSISLDHAIMERTPRAAVVPVDIGWSDIGSWSMLWHLAEKDEAGNVRIGKTITESTHNSYLHSDAPLVATVGIEDLVVVANQDAVLVAAKDRMKDLKLIVEQLKANRSDQAYSRPRVLRPWGSFESVDAGAGFQVKRLTVKSGAKLSLQKHKHRAEHWIVVSGTARVTRNDEVFDLNVNESTFIPRGARHRLENPGSDLLRVIEIRTGNYLGEDDIVRFDDVYGRIDE